MTFCKSVRKCVLVISIILYVVSMRNFINIPGLGVWLTQQIIQSKEFLFLVQLNFGILSHRGKTRFFAVSLKWPFIELQFLDHSKGFGFFFFFLLETSCSFSRTQQCTPISEDSSQDTFWVMPEPGTERRRAKNKIK